MPTPHIKTEKELREEWNNYHYEWIASNSDQREPEQVSADFWLQKIKERDLQYREAIEGLKKEIEEPSFYHPDLEKETSFDAGTNWGLDQVLENVIVKYE